MIRVRTAAMTASSCIMMLRERITPKTDRETRILRRSAARREGPLRRPAPNIFPTAWR